MTSKKKWQTAPSPKLQPERRKTNKKILTKGLVVGVPLLIIALFAFASRSGTSTASDKKSSFPYAVANPARGAMAPAFNLPSTKGGSVKLSDYRGKTVLLFFHEGIGCQPCWDQIRDLENDQAKLKSAGIDQLLTITSGPIGLIAQKMSDDRLSAIALSDINLAISKNYHANQFGMMGDSRDGHSFILVGPNGKIEWRADYGGAPKYTMYVPIAQMLKDMKTGRV
jgi:peroxiredoxin Q/BCP